MTVHPESPILLASLDALAALPAEAVDWVERLHASVGSLAASIEARLGPRLACARGCAGCCVDDLGVFEIEAAVIVRHHRALLEAENAGPPGACALLDAEGACRVYAHRPYVCRTQGLPLRWIEAGDDGAPVEVRDECPLNGVAGPPIEDLDPGDCFAIGPFEDRLAAMQARVDRGEGRRVALRALVQRRAPGAGGDAAARRTLASR